MSEHDDDSGERTVSELEEVHGTLREIHATLKSRFDLTGVSIVFFVALLLEGWAGSKLDRFTDRLWCSMRYGAEWKNIHVYKRPSDCDFTRSPLGSKGCMYKKHTDSFGGKERQAFVSQATTEGGKARIRENGRLGLSVLAKEGGVSPDNDDLSEGLPGAVLSSRYCRGCLLPYAKVI